MTGNESSDPRTVAEILADYDIHPSGVDSMPAVALAPRIRTRQTGSLTPSDPLVVCGQSDDDEKHYVFLLAGVQMANEKPSYIALSAARTDYRLGHLPLVGGSVPDHGDVVLDYGGTGLATGTFGSDILTRIDEMLATLDSSFPLRFPTRFTGIDRTPGCAFLNFRLLDKGHLIFVPDLTQNAVPAWTDVDSGVGSLYVRRLGCTYEPHDGGLFTLKVWVDGSVAIGKAADPDPAERKDAQTGDKGIALEVIGLRLGFTTNADYTYSLVVGLPEGYGLHFVRKPVEIGGGFAVIHDRPEYDILAEGGVTLSMPGLNFELLGAYARAHPGNVSPAFAMVFLFLLLRLTAEAENTPPQGIEVFPGVMLTGLCFGFGMNCELRVPDPATVLKFPLLAPLLPAAAPSTNSPLEVMDRLTSTDGDIHTEWVTPQDGAFWFAVGVAANIVEVFDIWALLIVSIPRSGEWAGALIGTLDMSEFRNVFKVKAVVEAEVSAGLVAVGAALAPNSYLFSEDFLSISGAIDLYVYVGGEYRNQWVLTAGGYPVGYTRPSYYPNVRERLGISTRTPNGKNQWQGVSGQAYLMFSNSGMAVGASLTFTLLDLKIWKLSIKGWFAVSFDFWVQWHPFYINASLRLSAGLQVKLLVTVKLEVSVGLAIWMPRFGGRAEIRLPFGVKFYPSFGSDPAPPAPLSWDECVQQLLPGDGRLLARAESGLLPVPGTPDGGAASPPDSGSGAVWHVSVHGFVFTTSCTVPSTSVVVNGASSDATDGLNVRPMGHGAGEGLASVHTVTITHEDTGLVDLHRQGWVVDPVAQGVPEALWGKPLDRDAAPGLDSPGLVDAYTGLRVRIPDAALGAHIPAIDSEDLDVEPVDPDSSLPIDPTATTPPDQPHPSAGATVTAIATTLTARAAARTRLDAALRNCRTLAGDVQDYSPHTDDALTRYETRVAHGLYTADPLTL
ncbi:DUF6603 domain-containing protein [Nocardia sp. alder85J]|uniref:DUF6603 domain-containing protein n=1 Tax=Nocardia sp. alder85J TaxID=2862949 RepID=UPI001CD37AAC|nr:DUF6603 domain-containing protein [Nocardia sp. alder85J]MCX4096666.1 hypothetical protein [Nocardia sp. alder85J]